MPTGSYDRYGLTGNPFLDLASESLEDIGLFHVNLKLDETLRVLKDEIFDKESRAMVALVGPLGSGKTERLRLAASEANQHKAFSVYVDVAEDSARTLHALAQAFGEAAKATGQWKTFSGPKWLGKVTALRKIKGNSYDPTVIGKTLSQALNESAPAFFLLNDLHNIRQAADAVAFAKILQEMSDGIRPGALMMVGSYFEYFERLVKAVPALGTRINRTIPLPRLTDDEAILLLAKKLASKRLVEGLDPLYPFSKEAMVLLNHAAAGNPRRLLSVADLTLQYGVDHRAYRIDQEVVRAAHPVSAAPARITTPPGGQPAPAPPGGPRSSAPPVAVKSPPGAPGTHPGSTAERTAGLEQST